MLFPDKQHFPTFLFFIFQSTPAITSKIDTNASSVLPPLDKNTLLMQEQLIQKQKELLELQQQKLELEVLQTKVKLQEIKNTAIPGRPQVSFG